MPKQYDGMGISFLYPENWKLTEETIEDVVSGMMLESPEGAFLSVNRYSNIDDLEEVIHSAKEAMESEYEEVESETEEITIAEVELRGTVQRFYYLDLIITSKLFAFLYEHDTYLVQIQGEDRDVDRLETVFRAMLTSMLASIPHDD